MVKSWVHRLGQRGSPQALEDFVRGNDVQAPRGEEAVDEICEVLHRYGAGLSGDGVVADGDVELAKLRGVGFEGGAEDHGDGLEHLYGGFGFVQGGGDGVGGEEVEVGALTGVVHLLDGELTVQQGVCCERRGGLEEGVFGGSCGALGCKGGDEVEDLDICGSCLGASSERLGGIGVDLEDEVE
jgi:hypothetical protein